MIQRGAPRLALNVDDLTLASGIAECLKAEAIMRDTRQRREAELIRRMEANGATSLDHPTLVVRLEFPSPSYDIGKLRRLYEVAPKEEVDKAVTPAHDEVVHVSEKWSAVKFKTLLKYGVGVFEVIEAAKLPGGPARLRITEKKESA